MIKKIGGLRGKELVSDRVTILMYWYHKFAPKRKQEEIFYCKTKEQIKNLLSYITSTKSSTFHMNSCNIGAYLKFIETGKMGGLCDVSKSQRRVCESLKSKTKQEVTKMVITLIENDEEWFKRYVEYLNKK